MASIPSLAILLVILAIACYLYLSYSPSCTSCPSHAYILLNNVHHSRLLPTSSKHSFSYPTLSLLLSLRALESHSLDLFGGYVFCYGGLYFRLTGVRPDGYFMPDSKGKRKRSITQKLTTLLEERGIEGEVEDVWMVTMPSYLGFEGINPLTVYFVYNSQGSCWLVILEIHNTFGESHIHLLSLGPSEDPTPLAGYTHQWTFPRSFHVSPFNDRSGYYRVAVTLPPQPPSFPASSSHSSKPHGPHDTPKPKILIRLHMLCPSTTDKVGPLKLLASLTPTSSTTFSTPTLLQAISNYPFVLLLTFTRIAYNAWILHYIKRLDVFVKPEPHPISATGTESEGYGKNGGQSIKHGGVKYLPESVLESYARQRVENFFRKRAHELGLETVIIPTDPSAPIRTFSPPASLPIRNHLTIRHTSPSFYTLLLISPSPAQALLLDRIWTLSDEKLFLSVFSAPAPSGQRKPSLSQRLRCYPIPSSLLSSDFIIPAVHPLDVQSNSFLMVLWVIAYHLLTQIERGIFLLFSARVVAGREPWNVWVRAEMNFIAQRGIGVQLDGNGREV